MNKLDLKGVTLQELQDFVASQGEPRFRASQILNWLYNRRIPNRVDRLENMSNLSKNCIEKFTSLTSSSVLTLETAEDSRFIFSAQDNNPLHTVVKNETIYLATQIGCAFECQFCSFGKTKLVRNLTTGEVVDQILQLQKNGASIKRIAFSGMGEPLANLDVVLGSIKIINSEWGLDFPLKNIYLYTCGLPQQIKMLADIKLSIGLSVGFHSAEDKTRSALMSINNQFPIDQLLDAVKYYGRITGDIVELEYILLEGMNDGYADAKLLIKKLIGLPVKLNLVTYNPVPRRKLEPVNFNKQDQFLDYLLAGNIRAEIKG